MKIGILGAGTIAHKMAQTICKMQDDVVLYAIASRNLEKAQAFAQQYGIQQVYTDYEAMAKDDAIDLIYIATLHNLHYEHALLCIRNHKNILVEKPFMINRRQAEEVFALAEQNQVLVCEAMWTYFLPSASFLTQIKAKNLIGNITSMQANIGYDIRDIARLTDKNMAGGALLDIGIYLLYLAKMVFQDEVSSCTGTAQMLPSGVDAIDSITMQFQNGGTASLHATMLSDTDCHAYIYGDKGYLKIDHTNHPTCIQQYNKDHELVHTFAFPLQHTGFEYEIEVCKAAWNEKALECTALPHHLTLEMLGYMDALRKDWDIVYPFPYEETSE